MGWCKYCFDKALGVVVSLGRGGGMGIAVFLFGGDVWNRRVGADGDGVRTGRAVWDIAPQKELKDYNVG